jgi:hypothetical protein
MATTTNYGWTTPDDTALVKDGAAAIRTLGSSVDTTTKNLNPETTLGDIAYRSSTANVKTRLGIGSTGDVLTVAGGVPTWAAPAGGTTYAIFRDQKTQNTDGGSFSSGAWRTRDLNTATYNTISGASLASNQMTLPAGTYLIDASAQAYNAQRHQIRLYNITDSSITTTGQSSYDSLEQGESLIKSQFVIAAQKDFEIQHRCENSQANSGFGLASNFGTEVYTQVIITKVA